MREVIGERRGLTPKFPGSCAQNAASSPRSSRATVIPVSASSVRASAIRSLSSANRPSPFAPPGASARTCNAKWWSPITNSLLVSASRASTSSSACESAKSPAFAIRICCRRKRPCPVALVRNVNDWVSTNGNGAERSPFNIPTTVGVGFSLIPSTAPKRVEVGRRYSITSLPKRSRVVQRRFAIGARGSGTRWNSPFTSSAKNSRSEE